MEGKCLETERNGRFGDTNNKLHGSIRIAHQNVHGIPESKKCSKSYDMIKTFKEWEIDVWGMSETNIIWHNIGYHNQWKERMTSLQPHVSNFAYNRHETLGSDKFLPGGVAQITTKQLAGRIIESGKDNSGLGRWVWQKLQGRFNHMVRIITYYRPCNGDTQDVEASYTTFAQHQRYYDHPEINPRIQLVQDLADFLQ